MNVAGLLPRVAGKPVFLFKDFYNPHVLRIFFSPVLLSILGTPIISGLPQMKECTPEANESIACRCI